MGRREEILEAAKELLARFGFKKTTMEDIAKKIHVTKATLYHYFSSKEDILREIVRREGEKLRDMLEAQIKKGKNAEEKLKLYAYTRFEFLRNLGLYYRTLREDFYSHMKFIEKERENFDRFEIDTLSRILEEGVKNGEFSVENPKLYGFLLLQAIKGLEYPIATGIALNFEGKEIPLKEALNLLLNILLNGIKRK